jgi:hypothetical protein
MAAPTFGLGTPLSALTSSLQQGGLSPYSGVGVNPFLAAQFSGQSSFPLTQTAAFNPYTTQTLQQILQLLQIVPQQLQHILQLEYLQQHQLQQLQQVLHVIPAQLQQLIQFVPQYIQQTQQPFGTGGATIPAPWGLSPQILGAQPSYLM